MTSHLRLAAAAGAAALALAACGDDADDGAASAPSAADMETVTETTDALESERPQPWTGVEESGEAELRFTTWMGNPECYGIRYEAEEDEDEVAVALITGVLPDSPEVCTTEVVEAEITVPLEEPLGDREVVELEDLDIEDSRVDAEYPEQDDENDDTEVQDPAEADQP
ncbi:hypothetical protein [Nesterenkonia pannonica]|uniref:hypothetical protein n=1 Tax=Nesterenkonia pannonica TaxID=1548602 RepID=UPI002164EE77|nr:hypothetical protein [Nesterenkonia pannonica]